MINIKPDGIQVITILKAHTSCIEILKWDPSTKRLFSAGQDHSIIVWDIGGGLGTTFELHGHTYV